MMLSIKPLIALALLASVTQLPLYEPNPEFQASEILSQEQLRSEDHTVREIVSNDGFFNHYQLETPFGDFEAEGNRALKRRIQEAHALAELDRVSKSDLYIGAAKNAIMAPVQAVDRFIDAPVETVKGIPGGVSRKFRSIGRSIKRGAKNVSESGEDSESDDSESTDESGAADENGATEEEEESKAPTYARKWFGVTSSERRWAQKLSVDPYSDNTVLREKMREVAKVDATANFGAKLMMPGLGAVGYVVSVSNLVWSLDGEELRAHNLKQLQAVGITEEEIDEFLNNPVFSPTHQAFIVQSMVDMKDVESLNKILSLSNWVETGEDAWFYMETILLMARFHQLEQPVHALAGEFLFPALVTQGDEVVYVVPVDYLSWSETLSDMLTGPLATVTTAAEGGNSLWINGQASDTVTTAFSTMGWSIKTGVSLEPPPQPDEPL